MRKLNRPDCFYGLNESITLTSAQHPVAAKEQKQRQSIAPTLSVERGERPECCDELAALGSFATRRHIKQLEPLKVYKQLEIKQHEFPALKPVLTSMPQKVTLPHLSVPKQPDMNAAPTSRHLVIMQEQRPDSALSVDSFELPSLIERYTTDLTDAN